ncbi:MULTISPECIES: type II secretion system F family protein [Cysteiniphilum]|uniref:type II secretion system F family protein n=1 Tax=Cysteiniphilum TaxID=2056696 RepID=UPI001783784A|nr:MULTISPECIES: type II secretion system F family protein [Cysteiniphilum]
MLSIQNIKQKLLSLIDRLRHLTKPHVSEKQQDVNLTKSIYPRYKQYFLKIQMSTSKRIEFYETLSMLLKVGSFGNAITQMLQTYQKNRRTILGRPMFEPKQIIIDLLKDVSYRHHHLGLNSVEAIRPYLPESELMMLSGTINVTVETLENTASIARKLSDMRAKILRQLVSPMVYLLAACGMLVVVNMGLKPVIDLSGNLDKMPASTQVMMNLSQWFVDYYQWVVAFIILLIVSVIVIMKYFVHPLRLLLLDKIPPFSIYKKISAVRFLISLSLLLKGKKEGNSSTLAIPEAIESIQKYSSRYTRYFLMSMRQMFSRGMSSGEAFSKSGFFGKELNSLIEMYAQSNQLKQGIYALGNEYLSKQIQMIESAFKAMNFIFLLALGGFISWYVDVMFSLNQAFAVH